MIVGCIVDCLAIAVVNLIHLRIPAETNEWGIKIGRI